MTTEQDLTTVEGVKALMRSSRSEEEWNDNCNAVKRANGGYQAFWFGAVVLSGLAAEVKDSWGVSATR